MRHSSRRNQKALSQSIFGIDNKHRPKTQGKNKRKGYHGRIIEYEHIHNNENDKATPYTFVNAEKLLTDQLNLPK